VLVVAAASAAIIRNTAAAAADPARTLRVCADPNNLPFSNRGGEGFENRLAAMIADDLHLAVAYTWWAQRRGFVRNTIASGRCDVVMGVPSGFDRTLVTHPYYRSSYAFVSRRDDRLAVRSFDDPALRRLRVGIQVIGDGESTPPAQALAARGIVGNLVGYTVYGNYVDPNPPARIVEAVARGDVDIALVWGPLAGYFASQQPRALTVQPVAAERDRGVPLAFDIAVGVARSRPDLRDAIDGALTRRRSAIERLLDAYGVPQVSHSEDGDAR
jgi:quinoprotein dehydrogenase-associated probable ABC transporter substrate-binding protein